MSSPFTVMVALLAAVGSAAPAPVEQRSIEKRSFTVPRQVNPAAPSPNGWAAMTKVFNKYGFEDQARFMAMAGMQGLISNTSNSAAGRPNAQAVKAGNGTNPNGEVAARPGDMNAASFLSPVNIGGQTVMLDFDSGSSDLWTFSTLQDPQETAGHNTFDFQKSATFQPAKGATWKISYGDGSGAQGVVGTDLVTVGGVSFPNQTVELATAVSQTFARDTKTDGLLGLAFSKINTVKQDGQRAPQKTFFDSVMPSLDQPVFVADLNPDGTGVYDFGKVNQSKFVGQMAWAPVNNSMGFWQFDSKKFAVGNKIVNNPNASPAIADTGTSLLLVDQNVAAAYYSQVKGAQLSQQAGGFIYPCKSPLPDLSLAAGNNMIRVPGKVIKFANVDARNTTCFGGVQGNGGAPMQIYGDVMFRAQLVAFNGGNMTLGFGQKPI